MLRTDSGHKGGGEGEARELRQETPEDRERQVVPQLVFTSVVMGDRGVGSAPKDAFQQIRLVHAIRSGPAVNSSLQN